jgi:dCTP diphosphatase
MLSNKCGIDLPAAALRKIGMNAVKYPAARARGSDKKYTEYAEPTGANSTRQVNNNN